MSTKREVIVRVKGGVVQDVEVPPGVVVRIWDYDNAEGYDDEDSFESIKADEDGELYQEGVYTADAPG